MTSDDDPKGAAVKSTAVKDEYRINSFASFLANLEDGELHSDLTDHYEALVAEMREISRLEHSKVEGELTITVKMICVKDIFKVLAKVKVKAPARGRRDTILWGADQGDGLTKANPKQRTMFGDAAARRDKPA